MFSNQIHIYMECSTSLFLVFIVLSEAILLINFRVMPITNILNFTVCATELKDTNLCGLWRRFYLLYYLLLKISHTLTVEAPKAYCRTRI